MFFLSKTFAHCNVCVIDVITCIRNSSFVLPSNIPFYEYTTVYPSVDEHLACFQLLGSHEKANQSNAVELFFHFSGVNTYEKTLWVIE